MKSLKQTKYFLIQDFNMKDNTKYIIGGVLVAVVLVVWHNSKKAKEQEISEDLSNKSNDELKMILWGLSRGIKAPTAEQQVTINKIVAILKLRGVTDYNN